MTTRPYRRLYFLHVWAEPRDDPALPPQWRYRLEDSATQEQRLFSQPDALAEFLQELQVKTDGAGAGGDSAKPPKTRKRRKAEQAKAV